MGLNDINSLSHTKWHCKYHIVFAPKYRRKAFFQGCSTKTDQKYRRHPRCTGTSL
jgi:REP element-mobilizing transposase RayT